MSSDPQQAVLTPAELEILQARCDAATQGPWAWANTCEKGYGANVGAGCFAEDDEECLHPLSGDQSDRTDDYTVEEGIAELNHQNASADADLIASARTDIPRLIASHRQLQTEIDAVCGALGIETEDGKWWACAEPGPVECAGPREAVQAAIKLATQECKGCDGSGEVYSPTSCPDDDGWQVCSTCGGSCRMPTADEIALMRERTEELGVDLQIANDEAADLRQQLAQAREEIQTLTRKLTDSPAQPVPPSTFMGVYPQEIKA